MSRRPGVGGAPPLAAFAGRRLAPPLLLAVAIVATAPFLGTLRDLLFDRLGQRAVLLGTGVFVVLVAIAFLVAVVRVRRHRLLRYAGLAVCLGLVWAQVAGFSTGIAEVDLVERVHVLEYGLLAALFWRAFQPLGLGTATVLAVLSGTLVGIVDEWLQWSVASRVGEAGDVAMNTAATGTGALFALILFLPAGARRRPNRPERAAIAALAAIVVLVFAGFFHCAHLGDEHRDRELGVAFRSWHSAAELAGAAEERGRRWRAGRLPTLSPLDAEDYYFIEGTSHVAHRNSSLHHGDVLSAWAEQRILERYYAPVLEQRGLHSGEPLDLPPEQREALESSAELLPPSLYSSPVLVDRIVMAPGEAAWWVGSGALAAALLAFALQQGMASRGDRPRAKERRP